MRAEAVTGQDYGLGLHVVLAETVTGQDYGHGRFRTRRHKRRRLDVNSSGTIIFCIRHDVRLCFLMARLSNLLRDAVK